MVQKGQKGAKKAKKGYIFHILLNKLFQQKYVQTIVSSSGNLHPTKQNWMQCNGSAFGEGQQCHFDLISLIQYLIADHPRTTLSEENWNITNMSSRRRKYSENIMFTYSSISPPVMPSYSQISHFGGIQAHFHFMSSQLFYAQTFPHSTITNILEKTVLKPHLIFEKHQFH